MAVERDPSIRFHEQGTLESVTRWMSSHDEGIAEWLKNARRAYQHDRANVVEDCRVAVLLLKDKQPSSPGRIGLLDVGGATLDDVTAWSTWQDPNASRRSSSAQEEQTQGNGGKAYMYRFFEGPARILGLMDGKRNCKGFEGLNGAVERGTPGFMPNAASGREVPVTSLEAELRTALAPYGVDFSDLPTRVQQAIRERAAFTLVEGESPLMVPRGRIDAEDLIARILRHEQSTLAIEQLRVFAFHNGRPLNGGGALELPRIEPFEGLEGPFVHPVPGQLALENGQLVSTTEHGSREPGRLVLHTSRENMPNAYKNLKPRWRISYRTTHQMIGAKPVSDLAPNSPGSSYVYGVLELPALEPGYVDHGRRRPKDGPLVEAVDAFMAEKIRELAKKINDRRKREQDTKQLDAVQEENQKLDRFKNKYLPSATEGDGGSGNGGEGPPPPPPPPPPEWGTVPAEIELRPPGKPIFVGCAVKVHLNQLLWPRVLDVDGRPVRSKLAWHSSDNVVGRIADHDTFEPRNKGICSVSCSVDVGRGRILESPKVPVEVWAVDHVLLTPRKLELPLGSRERITAEVTDDEGRRSTDVLLEWTNDADDPMIVRVSPSGWVTANRIGRATVKAGAGPLDSGVWSRMGADVHVVPSDDRQGRGGGFPRLLVTGRDIDPATQQIKQGDPDSPALWQEVADYDNNVWSLNLQSPEAAYAFARREELPEVWRGFHAQILLQMVVQVYMQVQFTRAGDRERTDYWANHAAEVDRHRVRMVDAMWPSLEKYVRGGEELE